MRAEPSIVLESSTRYDCDSVSLVGRVNDNLLEPNRLLRQNIAHTILAARTWNGRQLGTNRNWPAGECQNRLYLLKWDRVSGVVLRKLTSRLKTANTHLQRNHGNWAFSLHLLINNDNDGMNLIQVQLAYSRERSVCSLSSHISPSNNLFFIRFCAVDWDMHFNQQLS